MKLQIFSDVHHDLKALERLLAVEADHYIAAGDLVNWSRGLDAVGELLQTRAPRVHVLPGNHEHADTIAVFCARFALHALHGQSFTDHGWRIAGLGHSSPTPFDTPGEYSEAEFETRLAALDAPGPLVLVCHAPPLGTALDEAAPGRHFGSRAVAEFLARRQPEYFFCGHIHEAAGRTIPLGRTQATNVGKLGYLLEL